VREKQDQDQAETAKLISRGTPVARINTGIDGGMNRVFASKLPDGNTGLSEPGDGPGLSVALARAPGTIPQTVNPPRGTPDEPFVASPAPAAGPVASTRVASAAPNAPSDGFFSNLARKVGLGGTADATTASTPPPTAPVVKPKASAKHNEPTPRPEASIPKTSPTSPRETSPKAPDTKQAAGRPTLKPSVSADTPAAAPAPRESQVAGSQAIVPANSFESRFSAAK
jgi:hypothetical protein